jgi:hypothetical protein
VKGGSGRRVLRDVQERGLTMAVKLNARSFNLPKHLVREGQYVFDDRDDWSEHQPSTQDENKFVE